MVESQVEAPQTSRAASAVRTTRATRHPATDITAAFDQILASAAQPAQQAAPQSAPTASEPFVDAVLQEAPQRETSLDDQSSADDERRAERQDAVNYAAAPSRPEPPVRAVPAVHAQETTKPAQWTEHAPVAASAHASSAKPASQRTVERPPKLARESVGTNIEAATKAAHDQKSSEAKLKIVNAVAKDGAPPRPAVNPAEAVPPAPRVKKGAAETSTKEAKANVKVAEADTATPGRRQTPQQERVEKAVEAAKPTVKQDAKVVAPQLGTTAVTQSPEATTSPATASSRRPKGNVETTTTANNPAQSERQILDKRAIPAEATQKGPSANKNSDVSSAPVKTTEKSPEPAAAVQSSSAAAVAATAATKPRESTPVAETRRSRESRVATSSNAESRTADSTTSPAPVVAQPVTATATPAVQSQTNVAPLVSAAQPVSATPAVDAKSMQATASTGDRHAATPAIGSTGAARENGKSLLDSAKQATTTARTRNDQQLEVDRVRLVQRVAKALQTAQDRGAPLRLRLTPPELGVLKIELVMRDGALSAKLEAETPAAKAAILDNLPALRERLTAQEIKIERFDVDLMQQPDSSGGGRQSFADAESSRERAATRQVRNERAASQPTGSHEPKPPAMRSTPGRLNVLA
ncbi:MAG: flagellar hook-length control protein FliK [Planctomycetia bacterium]|nr:flagellar hook-length control protein FliK [Planctomycetia bacterium]